MAFESVKLLACGEGQKGGYVDRFGARQDKYEGVNIHSLQSDQETPVVTAPSGPG